MSDENKKSKEKVGTFVPLSGNPLGKGPTNGLILHDDGTAEGYTVKPRTGTETTGDYISLSCNCNGTFSVEKDGETVYEAPGKGPAQVASAAYRNGWERIFGAQKVAEA